MVILAAGQGTRMKSSLPKVLHPLAGRPLLAHVLDTAIALEAAGCHIVHGHGADAVRAWCESSYRTTTPLSWVLQERQLGTAHAVLQAMPKIPDDATVLVAYGDVPLIRPETLRELICAAGTGAALLTAVLDEPFGYGRILRDRRGAIVGIVEERDASEKQRAIREVNTGFMVAPAKRLKSWLARIDDKNEKREFYLTDFVRLALKDKVKVTPLATASPEEVLGVNDRAQLAQQERAYQRAKADKLMRDGLNLADPARFDLRGTLKHGRDCSLDVGVVVEGDVELGDNVTVGPYVILRNARLGDGTKIDAHSVLDFVDTGRDCRIGPFARIRPETRLGDSVHIGNFVEVKKSTLGPGAKANHLAYVGDATIGARVNVGAGVITVNYDGAHKHPTVVGDDAFIGSDTQLVAPVKVGDGATVGAGSTITRDVPPGVLAICRAREQKVIPGWQRPTKKK
ncbi:MAG TPA: bifunctional UDP-N-acetylglucosamine diphosphorylase/glucosamine-1-phosphate N-acetyltransferase GlmU [Nevskiaceae bacterium]|nr:bifunctional UDP-N-acetylglucosamine diphosphorylase/glucosamine-1-phosphate N-acetyltransferase GlmU [Nevskiaceae bacterium]